MAVVLAFRVAIALTPVVYRFVAAGGSTYPGAIERGLMASWSRLNDPMVTPEELQEEMSAGWPEDGAAFLVADVTGTFELRKLQWRLSRAPTGGTIEDQDVMTFHFLRTAAGAPIAYTDTTELAAVESAVTAFWGTMLASWPAFIRSDQYRWYKDGPAFWELHTDGDRYVPITPNPAIRVTEVDTPGGASASSTLPPQVAISVTEKVSMRKSWGRFYLPAPSSANADNEGRLTTAKTDSLMAALVTMYNACRSAGMIPVVYSIPKPVRPKKPSGELPAQAGIAYEITSLQIDNLFDVIRRRRYDAPTYRKATVLT